MLNLDPTEVIEQSGQPGMCPRVPGGIACRKGTYREQDGGQYLPLAIACRPVGGRNHREKPKRNQPEKPAWPGGHTPIISHLRRLEQIKEKT